MSFDAAAATALFAALESHAMSLGIFDRVSLHEPANAPGKGLSCSIVMDPAGIVPTPAASGLAAVSGTVTFLVRIYSSFLQKPLDSIDPALLGAAATLLGEYAGNFTLAGTVRDIDVLAMRAAPAYLSQDGHEYRVMQITLPVVVNDMWGEVA